MGIVGQLGRGGCTLWTHLSRQFQELSPESTVYYGDDRRAQGAKRAQQLHSFGFGPSILHPTEPVTMAA